MARAEAEAARQEVSSAHDEDDAASLKMTQMAAQLAAASQDGSAATSLRARVESMTQMLEEQQLELADGYHMAATMKLGAALGGRAGSALAHAVETWRRAGALLSAGQQPKQDTWATQEAEYLARIQGLEQDFRRTEKDNRGMALLVSDLETQLEVQKSTGATAPAPGEGRRARPPISPAVSRESSRPTSPKPAMSEVEAALHSLARKPRASSPQRTTLADQLQGAISSRGVGAPEASQEDSYCTFCGSEGNKNVVRCSSCYACYHIRCLTSSQAARFKGRRWLCDSCK